MRQLSLIGVAAVCAGVLSAHLSLHLTFYPLTGAGTALRDGCKLFCTDWVSGVHA